MMGVKNMLTWRLGSFSIPTIYRIVKAMCVVSSPNLSFGWPTLKNDSPESRTGLRSYFSCWDEVRSFLQEVLVCP